MTIRSSSEECQPAYCSGSAGRSEPSFGKCRRKSVNDTEELLVAYERSSTIVNGTGITDENEEAEEESEESEEEQVRAMIEVGAIVRMQR